MTLPVAESKVILAKTAPGFSWGRTVIPEASRISIFDAGVATVGFPAGPVKLSADSHKAQ